jgi:hypothetical protein
MILKKAKMLLIIVAGLAFVQSRLFLALSTYPELINEAGLALRGH